MMLIFGDESVNGLTAVDLEMMMTLVDKSFKSLVMVKTYNLSISYTCKFAYTMNKCMLQLFTS